MASQLPCSPPHRVAMSACVLLWIFFCCSFSFLSEAARTLCAYWSAFSAVITNSFAYEHAPSVYPLEDKRLPKQIFRSLSNCTLTGLLKIHFSNREILKPEKEILRFKVKLWRSKQGEIWSTHGWKTVIRLYCALAPYMNHFLSISCTYSLEMPV